MRMETFIRKLLRLKAHTVVRVEERETEGELVVQVERGTAASAVGSAGRFGNACSRPSLGIARPYSEQDRLRDLPGASPGSRRPSPGTANRGQATTFFALSALISWGAIPRFRSTSSVCSPR